MTENHAERFANAAAALIDRGIAQITSENPAAGAAIADLIAKGALVHIAFASSVYGAGTLTVAIDVPGGNRAVLFEVEPTANGATQ